MLWRANLAQDGEVVEGWMAWFVVHSVLRPYCQLASGGGDTEHGRGHVEDADTMAFFLLH